MKAVSIFTASSVNPTTNVRKDKLVVRTDEGNLVDLLISGSAVNPATGKRLPLEAAEAQSYLRTRFASREAALNSVVFKTAEVKNDDGTARIAQYAVVSQLTLGEELDW